ncbi:sulfatase-like hydrolase/transferase [Olivibacter sp. XZL3]|uniref:sulfatase-like hydrolase/transferase n=1 Tax=Olivibacter sp. XZL3 TaxID=1735116 RepID=UPI0010651F25|nr:sulfatase-like hydrolase/transferase [Olivibacter sp. XZL3]
MKRNLFYSLIILITAVSCAPKSASHRKKPNILIIYADDVGYGDLSCYGASAVQTPYLDSLAKEGLRFTQAYAEASTCTPSRYAMLTGRYAFRNNAAILPGDAPLIIESHRETLASMLKKAGYTTGVVGKWHLGLGDGKPDWNTDIKPGPLEIGFDYSFLLPATADRVPTVYVENHRVLNVDRQDPIRVDYNRKVGDDPIGLEHPELLKMAADSQHSGTIVNGISRIGFMAGGHRAYWKDEDFATVFGEKAKDFIRAHQDKPFFLYYALPHIHVPRAPNPKFVGATKMGPRGDVIAEMDAMVGAVMQTLKELGLDKNTLVIFSSDNGPVVDDGYADQAVERLGDHKPAGILRGGKYSAYEGGLRVPMIVRWPGEVQPGTSNAVINQVDFFASFAQLAGVSIDQQKTAPDSENLLSALTGKSAQGRRSMLQESFTMGLLDGDWKYIAPVSKKTPDWLADKREETGLQQEPQLYNLKEDPKEQHNVATQYPEKTKELGEKLEEIRHKEY